MNDTNTCLSESRPTDSVPAPAKSVVRPAYDVREDNGQAILQVALPGVRKEDLTISAEEQLLVVTAERRDAVPESWKAQRLAARPDQYELRIRLSPRFNPAQTEAHLDHGVLTLRVEAREEAKPRQIAIH